MNIEELVMNTFMFIGMVVCILITAIAIVWLTCFVVRILVKSFGAKVSSYCDIMVEDIKTKAEHKKEIKYKKRLVEKEQKEEFVKIKLINKKRMNDIKKKNLSIKLRSKENDYSVKVLGVPLDDVEFNDPQEEVPDNGLALIEELFPSAKLPTEEVVPVEETEENFVETEEVVDASENVEVQEEVMAEEVVETPEVVEEPVEEIVIVEPETVSVETEFVSVQDINAEEPAETVAPVEPVSEPTVEEVAPVETVVENKPKKRGRKPKNR